MAWENVVKKVDLSLGPEVWKGFELASCPRLKEGVRLHDFQQFAIYRSLSLEVSVNSLNTGLGKTVCSIATYQYYRQKYPRTKLLVLTTTSAILQFESEFYKFFEVDEKIVSVHPEMKPNKSKFAQHREDAISRWLQEGEGSIDVLIMNYECFRKEFEGIIKGAKKLQKKDCRFFAIFDEATKFRSLTTSISRKVKTFTRLADKVVALTATFTKGKLEEIYSICSNLTIQLSKNKAEFEREFCKVWRHPDRDKWFIRKIQGYKNVTKVMSVISPYTVVLRKSDVASSLPPILSRFQMVGHSEDQVRVIHKIYEGELDFREFAEGDVEIPFEPKDSEELNPFLIGDEDEVEERDPNKRYFEGLSSVNMVKMALLDPRLVHRQNMSDLSERSPKTEAVLSALIDEFVDDKVIIYTHSKMYLNLLYETIKSEENIPDFYSKPLRISGDISSRDREEAKRKFTESDKHNIILINNAGLEAINLQAANQMIITTLPYTAGDLVQLAGRFSRLGSKHSNLFLRYLLTRGSQDEVEYEIIMRQLYLMTMIMGEAEKGLLDKTFLMGKDNCFSEAEYQCRQLSYFLVKTRGKQASKYRKWFENLD